MREREYVRRQVAALSAEGTALRLGARRPAAGCSCSTCCIANRDYVMPLFTEPRGLACCSAARCWLAVGAFWMSRIVKVEV